MMTIDEQISAFCELFDGRQDHIGTEEGGSRPTDAVAAMRDHLLGTQSPIGIYPLVHSHATGWVVKWGCVDFDEGEETSLEEARRLIVVLDHVGVTGWLERSRSKGYHVWVFLGEWVEAWVVRRGLLAACTIAKVSLKEINPKSEGFEATAQLGNYVRLPYPGALSEYPPNVWDAVHRRVVLDADYPDVPFELRNFLEAATHNAGIGRLRELAAKYQPPKTVSNREVVDIDEGELEDAIKRVTVRQRHILMDGPKEGRDRSSTLYWLAQMLVEEGMHTYDECVALVRWADERWGQKFVDRHDADLRYREMVDKAWD